MRPNPELHANLSVVMITRHDGTKYTYNLNSQSFVHIHVHIIYSYFLNIDRRPESQISSTLIALCTYTRTQYNNSKAYLDFGPTLSGLRSIFKRTKKTDQNDCNIDGWGFFFDRQSLPTVTTT